MNKEQIDKFLDEVLKEACLQLSTGYPRFDSDKKLLQEDSIIIENVFNSLEEKMSNDDVVSKISQTDTEIIHECFAVIFLAAFIEGKSNFSPEMEPITIYKNAKSLSPSILKEKDKTLNDLVKYINVIDESLRKEIKKRSEDAYNCSKKIIEIVNSAFKGVEYTGVNRVYAKSSGGKKLIGDANISLNLGKTKIKELFVSLKYKNGQATAVSIPQIVKILYDIDLTGGLLNHLYKNKKNKTSLDNLIKTFITKTSYLWGKLKQESDKILKLKKYTMSFGDNTDQIKTIDNALNQVKKIKTFEDYYKRDNSNKRKLLAKIVEFSRGDKDTYPELMSERGDIINKMIDEAFTISDETFNGKQNKDKIVKLISTIFKMGEEPYLYCAMGGKKAFFVPSIQQVEALKNSMSIRVTEPEMKRKDTSNNWQKILTLYIGDDEVLKFDLLWRFGDGQFTTDYVHKGLVFDGNDKQDWANLVKKYGN